MICNAVIESSVDWYEGILIWPCLVEMGGLNSIQQNPSDVSDDGFFSIDCQHIFG